MLEVQRFLLNESNALDCLQTTYGLNIKRHGKYPNLMLFKYNQLESPMGENIVQECRGLILDESCDWNIVSYPFKKFFNYGEGHASMIDWSTARVQEKLDGSLMSLFFYDDAWHVSSSGSPDASGMVWMQGVDNGGFGEQTFSDLFWEMFEKMGYERPHTMFSNFTFMFEMMTPHNRIVVRYPESRLVLLAVRDNRTHVEMPVSSFGNIFNIVREFPITSMDDVIKSFDHIDPISQEGYVVVDSAFNRVKVKHPGYVAIHHMRDSFSPRRVVELIQAGESSEFLTYFPEFSGVFNDVKAKFDALVTELERDYRLIEDITVQKEFAIKASQTKLSSALFALRSGKTISIREFLKKYRVQNLMEILGV